MSSKKRTYGHPTNERPFNGSRYSWEKSDNFIPKIIATKLVKNIQQTFPPSTGAIFCANDVQQKS